VDDALRTLDDALARATTAAIPTTKEAPPPEAEALRELAFRLRKLRRAWGRPQSLGFFGPSQAGKSFLVGALLSQELGTLQVLSRTGEVDFLKEINPAKGVESTGTVTRFSTHRAPAPLSRGDFYCRLLSLEVMLESLATGFLVECTAPSLDGDRVDRVLREARMMSGPTAGPQYRQAWDTVWQNLHKKYQDRHPYLSALRRHPELRTEAWKKGVRSVGGWTRMFSLLWGGQGYATDLDALADRLVAGLEALGHPEAVELDLAYVRASSDNPSVIDAACLNAIGRPQAPLVAYVSGTQAEVHIEPSVLAALISEIRLPLRPVPGSLFETTDLLDFPGGRALRGINGFEASELNQGNLENAIEVYKRGKLTFLFEQFALDREITALVLCSPGPTKPEAIQMQHQVERWLQIRYGSPTPTDPEDVDRPTLFVALTKYDMSLGALRSDNAMERWQSRIEEACVEFWARSHASWVYNWGASNRPFNNMFWIRNPYADQMNALAPGHPDYAEVKQGYLDSRAARTFIAQHADKWAAVEGEDEHGLPRSGIPLLSSHLRAKLSRNLKLEELAVEARAIHGEAVELLQVLTPSRDEAEARERLEQQAKSLVAALRAEMARSYSGAAFGSFVETLTLPHDELEHEIRSFYQVVAPMSIKTSDKVKKLLVHVLKTWVTRAHARFRESDIDVPSVSVERFLRQVCTSRSILPVLGKAVFPYFSRSELDYPLLATIFQVKIADSLLGLFAGRERRTPEGAVRLSYSEDIAVGGGREEGADFEEVDWTDVDFDEEPTKAAKADDGHLDLVFAGRRTFDHWSEALPAFYVRTGGGKASAMDDPRVKQLVAVLREVEGLRL
jgi:hypothetical protein